MKRNALTATLSVLVFSAMLSSFPAHARDISGLCFKAGIGGEELSLIKAAYVDAVDAGIDEEALYGFFESILGYGLNCPQLVTVLSKSAALRNEGLPFWPLFSKVREGIAKGVPTGKIVVIVDERSNSLSQAARVIRELKQRQYVAKDYEGAVISISSYIEKGYSPDDIVERITTRGLENSGFSGLTAFLGKENN